MLSACFNRLTLLLGFQRTTRLCGHVQLSCSMHLFPFQGCSWNSRCRLWGSCSSEAPGFCRYCCVLGVKITVLPRSYWRSNEEIMESYKRFWKWDGPTEYYCWWKCSSRMTKLSYLDCLQTPRREEAACFCPSALNKHMGEAGNGSKRRAPACHFHFHFEKRLFSNKPRRNASASFPSPSPEHPASSLAGICCWRKGPGGEDQRRERLCNRGRWNPSKVPRKSEELRAGPWGMLPEWGPLPCASGAFLPCFHHGRTIPHPSAMNSSTGTQVFKGPFHFPHISAWFVCTRVWESSVHTADG